ncbi:MAG: peptide-methionine (S)-S-oxide reductase [Bdellovibrionota bacterium]
MKNVDPFNGDGQFCDKGPQYRSAIFYHNKAQENIARQSKKKLEQDPRYKKFGKVQTDMLPLTPSTLGKSIIKIIMSKTQPVTNSTDILVDVTNVLRKFGVQKSQRRNCSDVVVHSLFSIAWLKFMI